MKTRTLSLFGLAISGLFLFWLFKPSQDGPLTSQVLSENQSAPLQPQEQAKGAVKVVDYKLQTFDGQQVSLAFVNQDKPVVIQIWATWCHICEREFPQNNTIAQRYQGRIAYHAVNIGGKDQSPEAIKRYIERNNLDPEAIKFLVDMKGEVSAKYGFYSTPQHLFVKKGGEIIYYKAGYMTPAELESQIQRLIGS